MNIEDQYELWNRKDIKIKSVLRKDIHYAAVDAIHLMNVSTYLYNAWHHMNKEIHLQMITCLEEQGILL